jgi:hypothetical protein
MARKHPATNDASNTQASEPTTTDPHISGDRKHVNPRARGRRTIPPNRSPTRPEAIETWEKARQALQLRRTGMLWDDIAEAVGYKSRSGAYQAVRRFMKEYPREDAESLRDMEADRLDEAQQALWPAVLRGEIRATEVWVKLSERRSRLLGTDKPERKEVTVLTEDVVDKAIREAREEMERAARASGVEVQLPETAG